MSAPAKKASFDRAVDAACERLNNLHGIGKRHYRRDMVAVVAAVAPILRQDAAVAKLIEERDALHRALNEYPERNPHQLQARKVCEGILALARVGGVE